MTIEEDQSQRIRSIYCDQRRMWEQRHLGSSDFGGRHMARWDGGRDAHGRVHQPVWPRLAAFIRKNNLPPAEYIAFLFSLRKVHPLLPDQMMSAASLQQYQERQVSPSNSAENLDAALKMQILKARAELVHRMRNDGVRKKLGWSQKDILTSVLTDDSLPLSALFRYCLAVSERLPDVAARLRGAAEGQYMRNPDAYDRAWRRWLPSMFGAIARGNHG